MKSNFSKEYYEARKESLFAKYGRYCDYENDLNMLIPDFGDMPEDVKDKAVAILVKTYAPKVVAEAVADLTKTAKMIKEIKAGRASFGYTTVSQEKRAWYEMQERFEFSCYMLSLFKAKYNVA